MAWTAPDPLILNSKTRSIYITELQNYVNMKRLEIGKSSISFISQGISKKFKLSAIEELKVAVNTLAEDYGYSGGVTNSELLGRNYVNITVKYNNKVTHFPIINDLRRVLEKIENKLTNFVAFPLEKLGVFGITSKTFITGEYDGADLEVLYDFTDPTSISFTVMKLIGIDNKYIYYYHASGNGIKKRHIITGDIVFSKPLPATPINPTAQTHDIVMDDSYIYFLGNIKDPGSSIYTSIVVTKTDKNLNVISYLEVLDTPTSIFNNTIGYPYGFVPTLTLDKDNIYLIGGSTSSYSAGTYYYNPPPPSGISSRTKVRQDAVVVKIKKDFSSYTYHAVKPEEGTSYGSSMSINPESKAAYDNNYIYATWVSTTYDLGWDGGLADPPGSDNYNIIQLNYSKKYQLCKLSIPSVGQHAIPLPNAEAESEFIVPGYIVSRRYAADNNYIYAGNVGVGLTKTHYVIDKSNGDIIYRKSFDSSYDFSADCPATSFQRNIASLDPPLPPTSVSVINITSNSAIVTWVNPPASSTPYNGFKITCGTISHDVELVNSYLLTGLSQLTTYTIKIHSVREEKSSLTYISTNFTTL